MTTAIEQSAPAAAIRIPMVPTKECKGSVRYETTDEKAAVTNVYLSRAAFKSMPKSIVVSIEPK